MKTPPYFLTVELNWLVGLTAVQGNRGLCPTYGTFLLDNSFLNPGVAESQPGWLTNRDAVVWIQALDSG